MPAKSNPVLNTPSRRLAIFPWLAAFWFSALAVPVCSGQNATASLRVQPTPAAVLDVLEIQPFRLKVGYDFAWLESRPHVSDGLLVVLKVDPSLVVPRNSGEPVLYAGDRTVQRLNRGNGSGAVIGIIPGDIDLAAEPVWFGKPQLPERVTADVVKEQRTLADSAGIKPFSPEKVKSARRDLIEVDDLAALLRGLAADLVLNYAPDEEYLAATWRLPTPGSKVTQ